MKLDISELKATRDRCCQKLEAKARELQTHNPRLLGSESFALAVRTLPKTYAKYRETRQVLINLGVGVGG